MVCNQIVSAVVQQIAHACGIQQIAVSALSVDLQEHTQPLFHGAVAVVNLLVNLVRLALIDQFVLNFHIVDIIVIVAHQNLDDPVVVVDFGQNLNLFLFAIPVCSRRFGFAALSGSRRCDAGIFASVTGRQNRNQHHQHQKERESAFQNCFHMVSPRILRNYRSQHRPRSDPHRARRAP